MLDTKLISDNIIFLRQRINLTQQELASKVNVTHQAVSKWENGTSTPDIQTLLELSRLFGVTLDELLTEVLSARKDTPEADTEKNEFRSILDQPIPAYGTPNQEAKDETHAPEREQIELSTLLSRAPLIGRSKLHEMVAYVSPDSVKIHTLAGLAPFLSREDLAGLTEIAIRHDNAIAFSSLTPLAPFLSSDQLIRLVESVIERDPNTSAGGLIALAPFMNAKALSDIVPKMKNCTASHKAALMPFLTKEAAAALQESEPETKTKLSAFFPFNIRFHRNYEENETEESESGDDNERALTLAEEGDFDEIGFQVNWNKLTVNTIGTVIDKAIKAQDFDFLFGKGAFIPAQKKTAIALAMAENDDFDDLGEVLDINELDRGTLERIISMAIDSNETDFIRLHHVNLPPELMSKVIIAMAENEEWDELEESFDLSMLPSSMLEQLVDLAEDQDEAHVMRRLMKYADQARLREAQAKPAAPETKQTSPEDALNQAQNGDYSAACDVFGGMTDDQKRELVQLAIINDQADQLIPIASEIPAEPLKTLCLTLARLGENEVLEAFLPFLDEQTAERVRKIQSESRL